MFSKRDVITGASALLGATVLAPTANAAGAVVRMPISFGAEGMPLLKVTIGGKGPYNFLIDTGASAALVRETLAKELGMMAGQTIRHEGISGHEDSYFYTARDLVLGGGFKLSQMSLIGMANFTLPGADGILPASILTFVPSQLDYEASEIRYYLNGADMDLTDFRKVKALFEAESDVNGTAEKVFIEVMVDGSKLLAMVDTGSGSYILAGSSSVDHYRLWDKYPLIVDSKGIGVNGKSIPTRDVMAPNIAVGDLKVAQMPITLSKPGNLDDMGQGVDALLGTPFLRCFTVAFGKDKQIYLRPNSRFATLGSLIPTVELPAAVASTPDRPILPFNYGEDRHVIFPAAFADKHPFPARLNTGKARSTINSKWAAELGLSALPSGDFSGAKVEIAGVALPKLAFRPESSAGLDLGLDFLMALPSSLDFETHQMSFFIGSKPDLTGYRKMPVERKALTPGEEPRLYLTMTVEDVETVCLLDTSLNLGLVILPAAVKARGLWDRFADAPTASVGTINARRAQMKGAAIGSVIRYSSLTPILIDPAAPANPAFPANADAVVGTSLLQGFNYIFVDDAVWFRPKPRQSPAPGASTPPPAS